MRGRTAAILILALTPTLVGVPAAAQESAWERLEVSLWPEYDRPSVLVMYRITLPASTPIPATVRLRIPASAGEPNAVAEADASDNLVVAPYERDVEGDWAVLTITARSPRLQIEYYDPGLERDDGRRSFRYLWPGQQAVRRFFVDVQEPAGAVQMRVVPPAPGAIPGADGLLHHTLDLGAVAAGQERVVEIEYVKEDDALSVESVAPPPRPTLPDRTADRTPGSGSGSARWYRIGAGMLAVGLAGAVAYWLLFLRGSGAGGAGRSARSSAGKRRSGGAAGGRAGRFCTGCGAVVQKADRFCHACGEKLR